MSALRVDEACCGRGRPRSVVIEDSQKVYRFFTELQFGHTKKSFRKFDKVK